MCLIFVGMDVLTCCGLLLCCWLVCDRKAQILFLWNYGNTRRQLINRFIYREHHLDAIDPTVTIDARK